VLQNAPYNGSVPLPRADSSAICKRGHSEDEHDAIKARMSQKSVPSKREVRKHIKTFRNPPIQPRASSLALRNKLKTLRAMLEVIRWSLARHSIGKTLTMTAWNHVPN
jgi:hypothetical protein